MHDTIFVSDLRMQAIIGILDRERVTPQAVHWQVELEVPMQGAGDTGQLSLGVNYADVQSWLLWLTQMGRWRLIETVVLAGARLILSPPAPCEGRAQVRSVTLRIDKPDILVDAVPGVAVRRSMDWLARGSVVGEGVTLLRLADVVEGGAWKLVLAPGAAWWLADDCVAVVLSGESHGYVGGSEISGPASLLAGSAGLVLLVFGPQGSL
ncbi:MAG: dihydroneopterin aldolase [Kiritimatiellia bacterium]|jgi:dihydroneopterin aldolase